MTPLVVCERAARTFGDGSTATVALQQTSLTVEPGARIALVGPSGSGKSTLIHLMAGLDAPTSGSISWPALGERAALRPGPVAVVLQGPSLLPPLTVEENTALPLILVGRSDADAHAAARAALALVELADVRDKLPEEISGGQAQRAAVARALAGEPRLLLADEPTGQLDRVNGAAVVDALFDAADESGAALVVATHDHIVAEHFAEVWEIRDGALTAASSEETAWSR